MAALTRDDLTPTGQDIFDGFTVWHDENNSRFLILRSIGVYKNFHYEGVAVKSTEKAANREMERRRYWACWKHREERE